MAGTKKTVTNAYPRAKRRRYRSRLYRRQSPLMANLVPIASVLVASLITTLPILPSLPLLPPLGLMMLIAWRQLRPMLWPLWIGAPLGLFDDLFSGQPIGSGVFLWSVVVIALSLIADRTNWRDYWQDWLVAALCLIFAIVGGMLIVGLVFAPAGLEPLVPQILLSIFSFPIVARFVSALDRWRLAA